MYMNAKQRNYIVIANGNPVAKLFGLQNLIIRDSWKRRANITLFLER